MSLVLNLVPVLKQQFNKLISGETQRNNMKNGTYYFFNSMINIEDFYSNLLKIDKKSYKNIDVYCIGYIAIKNNS